MAVVLILAIPSFLSKAVLLNQVMLSNKETICCLILKYDPPIGKQVTTRTA